MRKLLEQKVIYNIDKFDECCPIHDLIYSITEKDRNLWYKFQNGEISYVEGLSDGGLLSALESQMCQKYR
jgi:hypothetical protein